MSLQTIEFDLQITPGSIPPVLHMSQYDSGRQYTAYLKDETNTAFIPGTGATAKLKGFNAAGVPWELAATVDGSTVVFTPSGAATDQFGIMPVTIEITVGSEKLTPLLMIFDIQRAGYTNEQAVRSPEFETAMEAAAAEALAEVGVLLAEDQATKTAAMTQAVGVDANGKLWITPGGGGGAAALFVTLTYSGGVYTTDTSAGDIYSAKQANYVIKLRDDLGVEYDLQSATSTMAIFSAAIDQSNAVGVVSFQIVGTTVTRITHSAPTAPIPGSSDNDKFLGVSNGVYTLRDDVVIADEEQIIVPGYTNQVDVAGYTAGALLHSDGSVEYSGSGVVTGFIAVTKGDVIRIKSSGQSTLATMVVALYKANKATANGIGKTFSIIISGTNYGSASVSGDTLTWDTASVNYYSWNDFAWMRITLPSSADIVTVNEEIVNVQTTRKTIPSDTKVLPASIVNPHKTLTGKKVVVFGDSIIGKCRDSTSVTAFAEDICGAECINVGFGGCRMSNHPTTGYAAFSMYKLADAIATNTWTDQDAEASSGESYFPAQLTKLKAIDFSTVDAIVIHYGTNDYNANVSLDNASDNVDIFTVLGALRYSINRILEAYPHITIFVSVPIYRAWNNGAVGAESHVNSRDLWLYNYCEGMKSVAQTYNLPVIDGYKSMGMSIANIASLTEDYTHLNEIGRSVFGKVMAGGLIAQNANNDKASARIEKMMVTGSTATLFEQVYGMLKTAAKSSGSAATQFSNTMATSAYTGAVNLFSDNALPRLVVIGTNYVFDWECSDYSAPDNTPGVASFHGSDIDSDGLYDIVASFTSTGVVMMKVTYTACPAIS